MLHGGQRQYTDFPATRSNSGQDLAPDQPGAFYKTDAAKPLFRWPDRANSLNFELVAHLALYKELESMGVESKRIEIFQFCDARIANEMVIFNPDFSAYLPCRITLMEDTEGQAWLITLDLSKVIPSANLTPELLEKAELVRDNIASIMKAGASGDL
ncbi:MAG: DUF302 domain-containing protein [Thiohalocapsa sp.]